MSTDWLLYEGLYITKVVSFHIYQWQNYQINLKKTKFTESLQSGTKHTRDWNKCQNVSLTITIYLVLPITQFRQKVELASFFGVFIYPVGVWVCVFLNIIFLTAYKLDVNIRTVHTMLYDVNVLPATLTRKKAKQKKPVMFMIFPKCNV